MLFFSLPSLADIYVYRDEKGMLNFTNNPVDDRYVLYKEEPEEKPDKPPTESRKEDRFDEDIFIYCSKHSVEPAFVKAVMRAESDFNPAATSTAGAIGLMQLMPETAERLGVRNPFSTSDNIEGGVKYLGSLLKKFGTHRLAAAAYNSGENAVEKYGDVPPYDETRRYVRKVLDFYNIYHSAGFGANGGADERSKIFMLERKDGMVIYTNTPWLYKKAGKQIN